MSTEHLHWDAESLWETLEPLLPGISIEVLARVDSTNTALLERVRADAQQRRADARQQQQRRGDSRGDWGRRAHDLQPCLLVAEQQTQGRGRMGRSWHSSAGASLTFSLALPMSEGHWSGLSLAVGTVIADALDPAGDGAPRLQLKWPNDILLDGRKLGGILIETVSAGELRVVVVGVGLNVQASATLGEAGFATGYASLDELMPGISAPAALARIARPLAELLRSFPQQGFAPWQDAYRRRDLLRGQPVSAGTLEGVALGVDAQGELLLQTADGQQQAVNSGEVSVRLSAGAGADRAGR